MTITLTTPESEPSRDQARLVSFTANTELRFAQAIYEVGFAQDGNWNPRRKVVVEWGENAERSFASLVQQVPEARDLRLALERWTVNNGIFTGVAA